MSQFIVIEGLDGAGKSTQIKLLLEHFQKHGIETKFIHFPRVEKANVYGDLIAKFLRGEFGPIDAVHPQLVALIFALDRFDFAGTIKNWLAAGYTVLADRYVLSNIAFQCAKLKTDSEKDYLADWIFNYEFEYNKIPKPDLSIYLDVPFSFTKKSLTDTRTGDERAYLRGKTDIHENSISFQEQVKIEYESILKKFNALVRVDCSSPDGKMLEAELIHKHIIGLLT